MSKDATVKRQRGPVLKDLNDGAVLLPIVLRARQLKRAGKSWRDIGEAVDKPWQTVKGWVEKAAHIVSDHELTAADLAPRVWKSGRYSELMFTADEIKAVQANLLLSNRDEHSGSTPEAVRQTIKEGKLRPEIVSFIHGRELAGKALLTEAMHKAVQLPKTSAPAFRSPRTAWLDLIQSPGSLLIKRDEVTGEERFYKPGERVTIDDATINLGCCVALEKKGDKCFEKFGVIVGRFQFILCACHRTRFLLGFSYTARPRSSYRAEDLTATLHTCFLEHGVPKEIALEHGVSASTLVHETLDRLGVLIDHVKSPHQKVVESIFNRLWTKLSFLPGQVGRFMGEEEELGRVMQSCRLGQKDPRKIFPMLSDVLKALREAIDEHNAHLVKSRTYSQEWIPKDFFAQEAPNVMRRISLEDAWMFSPVVSKPLMVRGSTIDYTVPIMPGHSVRYTFSHEHLHQYYGSRVQLFFNPFAPNCMAKVVLVDAHNDLRSGETLFDAEMTNRFARMNRRIFGYGMDEDIGLAATRQNAQALRRHVQSIRADGKPGIQTHEVRDGKGNFAKIETGTPAPAPGVPSDTSEPSLRSITAIQPQTNRITPVSEKEAERRRMIELADEALANVKD